MKSKTLKINEREITVSALPLGAYATLLSKLNHLPEILNAIDGQEIDQILQNIPVLVSSALDDFLEIIAVGSSLTTDEVKTTVSLIDATEIVLAIIEVNEYAEVWANIKKVFAQTRAPMVTPEPETPTAIEATNNG